MGTWGVSKVELVSKLTECLDDIEGDFYMETLLDALDFMKLYAPTSDSTEEHEKLWKNKMKEILK